MTTDPVQNLLDRLEGVKPAGPDKWTARCPAHDDAHASLSISRGDGGRALVHCHAGCALSAILGVLSMHASDLFQQQAPAAHRSTTRTGKTARRFHLPCLAAKTLAQQVGGTLAGWWPYFSTDDAEALTILRFDLPRIDPDTGKVEKTFRPLHPVSGGWAVGDPPGPLPLYRQAALDGARRVYVLEGEKCVDKAAGIGLVATTSAHGAESAKKTDWTPLAGLDVVVSRDADRSGLDYVDDVATILTRLDPPARVKVLLLPGLPPKGDIVDYLDAHDAQDSETLRRQIEALADAAPEWKPTADAPLPDADECQPILVCLADVKAVPVKWLWPGRIPLGRITLLVGRAGEGKSFLATDLAARITTGTPWPDGSACPIGSVIIISVEDDPGDTIRPRLDAHLADVLKVHLLSAVRHAGKDGKPFEVMFTLRDLDALETALKTHPDCKLVMIDPIGSFIGGTTDAHRDNEVRSVLAPVAALAAKYGPAVLVIAHRRKSGGTYADDLALGSRAFTGLARAVWHLSRDPNDKTRRLLLPGKNNLAPESDGLAFSIMGDPAALVWDRDPVTMNADEALAVENDESEKPGPAPDARSAAAEWLRDLLSAGPMAVAMIQAEAQAAGYAWRTVHRAKDELGIKPYKAGFGGAWTWRLPSQDATCHDPPKQGELGILASSEESQ